MGKIEWKRTIIYILIIIFCIIIFFIVKKNIVQEDNFKLKHSKGRVSVSYVDNISQSKVNSYDLAYISVDDIFTSYDTSIVEGIVKDIRNIRIQVGELEIFKSVVTIVIDKSIKGNLVKNSEINILVAAGSSISTVSDCMEIGMRGIFMPVAYDESGEKYHIKMGNNTLVLKDIADYGLLNGVYWLFLNKDGKYIFDREKYTEITNCKEWNEIVEYVEKKVNDF